MSCSLLSALTHHSNMSTFIKAFRPLARAPVTASRTPLSLRALPRTTQKCAYMFKKTRSPYTKYKTQCKTTHHYTKSRTNHDRRAKRSHRCPTNTHNPLLRDRNTHGRPSLEVCSRRHPPSRARHGRSRKDGPDYNRAVFRTRPHGHRGAGRVRWRRHEFHCRHSSHRGIGSCRS